MYVGYPPPIDDNRCASNVIILFATPPSAIRHPSSAERRTPLSGANAIYVIRHHPFPTIVGRILGGRCGCIRTLPERARRRLLRRDSAARINGPRIPAFGGDDNLRSAPHSKRNPATGSSQRWYIRLCARSPQLFQPRVTPAANTVQVVLNRIPVCIVLMILLSFPERRRCYDLRDDG